MTPDDVSWIEKTWQQVARSPEAAAEIFYTRLFSVNPELRALFKGDLGKQGQKLTSTIALVVLGLRRPESLARPVERLGVRHLDYGARPEHYPAMGAALLWTLHKGLGAEFTPEAEKAWTRAFEFLANAMISVAGQDD